MKFFLVGMSMYYAVHAYTRTLYTCTVYTLYTAYEREQDARW